MVYLVLFLLSCALSLLFTPAVRKMAARRGIVDSPRPGRKLHRTPTPLLGGLAVYGAFAIGLLLYLSFGPVNFAVVPQRFFYATFLGGALLMLGGYLDDRFDLPPYLSWLLPALAAAVVVASGIGVGIKQLSNPFGEPLSLDFDILGLPFSTVFIWLWVMGMTYTTKFLDGLDGLCAGVSLVAGLTLLALSLTARINQPETASLAALFCGALAGFLVYNFHPASIFLGEGGSTFLGFLLAVLSVILGGKIATAFLVMGIPILDVAWVIVRRAWYGSSPFRGDRGHLHYRLMDLGFSQRQTVLILYGISAVFGSVAVFLQSFGKLIALVALACVMLALAMSAVLLYKRRHPRLPGQPPQGA